MPIFAYKAFRADATSASGTIAADTARQARDLLRERGLTITEVQATSGRAARTVRTGGRREQVEVVAFIRELSTLLRAGIPLLSAIQTLSRQHSRRFQPVLQLLADRIASGSSLADAMAAQNEYFDELCVSIVQVGESTGSLETALRRLADFKESASALRNRVATALVYPAVVCVIGLAAAVFLMTFVVPNLLETLIQAGKPLPTVTRMVKGASDFLITWWKLLIPLGVGAVVGVRMAARNASVRSFLDHLYLRVPLIGDLIRKQNTLRMSVVLAALLRSGLPFLQALQITRRTVRNRVFAAALERYESAIAAGSDVAGPLEASGVFSPMVVQMLAVGQESGQLEEMLEQMAAGLDQELDTATARLTALMEPLLIVMLAILVGFIAFATILPILEAGNVM